MPRTCSTCKSSHRQDIERRIREDRSYLDISRWLREVGDPISNVALAKHAKEHMQVVPVRGRRAFKGRLLEGMVEAVEDGLESGDLTVSVKDGLAAQKALDARAARNADHDLMLKISLVLGGRRTISLPDPEVEAIEGEFRPLLSSGAE